jgi:hypothetical protein
LNFPALFQGHADLGQVHLVQLWHGRSLQSVEGAFLNGRQSLSGVLRITRTALSKTPNEVLLLLQPLSLEHFTSDWRPVEIGRDFCPVVFGIDKVLYWTPLLTAQRVVEDCFSRASLVVLYSRASIVFQDVRVSPWTVALVIMSWRRFVRRWTFSLYVTVISRELHASVAHSYFVDVV